ncbi:MAG: ParB/RepB/Spo0J family partition protein [Blastocatellia bacterium]|nr:ParB/RepB/Spo0J family partition protein [Blastocatellia bacterium]
MAKARFEAAVSEERITEIMALQKATVKGGIPEAVIANKGDIKNVLIDTLRENPFQPRKIFSEESLNELAANISQFGLLLPVITRPNADGTATIIAGHRRWLACKKIDQKTIKVIEREASDEELQILAVIENIHRDDLHAVDKVRAFSQINQQYKTQEQAAEVVGMKRTAFLQWLRVSNELSDEVLDICGEIETMSLKALMRLGNLPEGRRLGAARKLLTLSKNKPTDEKPKIPKPKKGQNTRLFEIQSQKHGFKLLVNVQAKTRKHQLTKEDIREALTEALKNLDG